MEKIEGAKRALLTLLNDKCRFTEVKLWIAESEHEIIDTVHNIFDEKEFNKFLRDFKRFKVTEYHANDEDDSQVEFWEEDSPEPKYLMKFSGAFYRNI